MTNTSNKYYSYFYTSLNEAKLQYIRKEYTVIEVDWLNKTLVNSEIFNKKYFEKFTEKTEIVNNMLEYYLNDKDKSIYKKTDYLCNKKEKICICNTHADDFRKIYDGINYSPNIKYVSWCKKENDDF